MPIFPGWHVPFAAILLRLRDTESQCFATMLIRSKPVANCAGAGDENSRVICFSERHDNSLRNIGFAQRMFESGQSDAFCEAL
jgi:hypothetical protein